MDSIASTHDRYTSRSTLTVDYHGYVEDVKKLEKPLDNIVTDTEQLRLAMKMAIAMGGFVDLVKKAVIYGKVVNYADIIAATDNIMDSTLAFERELNADRPEGYAGEKVPVNPRLLHAILGSYGENGELMEVLLKQIENRGVLKLFGKGGIVEEAGDDCWYDALRADAILEVSGVDLGMTMTMNIDKLHVRHGKTFSLETSENRDLAAEEATLADRGRVAEDQ